MIAYVGHKKYKYCYVSNERGAARGYLVGIVNPHYHEVVCPPDGHADQYGHLLAASLDLKQVVIDGLGIDGDGVFHGTPPRRVVDLDYSGVFHAPGDYNDRPSLQHSHRWFIFNDLIDCLHEDGRSVNHIPTLHTRFGKVFDSYGIA
jgi:hypothetical protein